MDAAPICKDCQFVMSYGGLTTEWFFCTRTRDIISGKYEHCVAARLDNEKCGKSGKWFILREPSTVEPKPGSIIPVPQTSSWQKIRRLWEYITF